MPGIGLDDKLYQWGATKFKWSFTFQNSSNIQRSWTNYQVENIGENANIDKESNLKGALKIKVI